MSNGKSTDASPRGRSEVAEALRKAARSDLGGDSLIRSLKQIMGLDLGRHVGWRQVYERLADLIDPTCEVVHGYPDYSPGALRPQDDRMGCSACGRRLYVNAYTGEFPTYCPRCGRRVVRR